MSTYQVIPIDVHSQTSATSRICIIYTGGTFGMMYDEKGALVPFDFPSIEAYLPSFRLMRLNITVVAFDQPIDSSTVKPLHWVKMAEIIQEQYDAHDGFVILHGTDTMAYSASALSFMLKGLNKPVVFTGAQLPISAVRSDARENLVTALEIASAQIDQRPRVPEVCILFNNELLRGNRSKKVQSVHFDAYRSENYPLLARAGVQIIYDDKAVLPYVEGVSLSVVKKLDDHVAVLKLYPGINAASVQAILQIPSLKGVVMETFGSGNAPTDPFFLALLESAIGRGIMILNISQCPGGQVFQGKYETSRQIQEIGVVGGGDMTTEAAVTKLMVGLGVYGTPKKAVKWLKTPVSGERSH